MAEGTGRLGFLVLSSDFRFDDGVMIVEMTRRRECC